MTHDAKPSELLPAKNCPFCGKRPHATAIIAYLDDSEIAECCGISMMFSDWNRRTAPQAAGAVELPEPAESGWDIRRGLYGWKATAPNGALWQVLDSDQSGPAQLVRELFKGRATPECACQKELRAMLAHQETDFDYRRACHCSGYKPEERCACDFCVRSVSTRGQQP